MNTYKHIIWDWNGTLIDDTWLCLDIMNKQLDSIEKPRITLNQYQRYFDFPVITFYEKIGFDFSVHNWEKVAQGFIDEYTERRFECSLQFGIPAILKKLSTFGFKHSILSAYAESVLLEMVDHYNLGEYFTHIVGLNNHYASGKVDEGRLLMEKLDVPADDVVLIGDTTHDFEVASELGIDSILISNGHHSINKLEKCGVPVVPSFSEAMVYLFNLK